MKCWHVDAFAERLFEGNPAAVCVLDGWLPDALMQSVAAENNLSRRPSPCARAAAGACAGSRRAER